MNSVSKDRVDKRGLVIDITFETKRHSLQNNFFVEKIKFPWSNPGSDKLSVSKSREHENIFHNNLIRERRPLDKEDYDNKNKEPLHDSACVPMTMDKMTYLEKSTKLKIRWTKKQNSNWYEKREMS